MKKKIFLWIILVLEAVLFVFLGVLNSYPDLKSQIPFNGFYLVSGYYYDSIKVLMQLTHFDVLLERMFGEVYPNLFIFISLVVVNLLFIGVYYLIFGPITISLNKKKEKEIREIVKPYELSNSEYEKFNYKNYLGNFPIKRIISLIIPLLFIALFVLVRFDRQLCSDTDSNIHGIIEVSNKAIEPAIGNFLKPFCTFWWLKFVFGNVSNLFIKMVYK